MTQSVKIGSDGVSLHLPLMNVDIHLIKVEELQVARFVKENFDQAC